VSALNHKWESIEQPLSLDAVGPACCWYAVQTHPRYEKKILLTLTDAGATAFLPLVNQVHRWSDRRMLVQVPLFPCYVFVRIIPLPLNRIAVLRTSGVISFVGSRGQGSPIPDRQIEDLRTLASRNVPTDPYPFLKVGQRVRIRGGCLEGIEGILVVRDEDRKVVVSVDTIQKSLAISVKGYDIEAV
jgi:transcription antitermination factor NusG